MSRALLVAPAFAAVALLAAGCGGSSGDRVAQLGSTTTRSSSSPGSQDTGELAFSRCMRSHGVAAYPDPSSRGLLPKRTAQQLGVGNSVLQAAESACIHFVPNGGRPTAAQVAAYRSVMLRYAHCIRANGVSNVPDPDSRGHLDIGPGSAVDVSSPRFQAAFRVCKRLLSP